MTEREKIIETLKQTSDIWKEEERHGYIVSVDLEKIADALIAAGIGDISKWQLMSKVLQNQIIENSREEKHRTEVVERALDKACEDIRKVIDCCWWAEKYIPEKVTPQAYIERSEKERRSEQ